MDVPNDVRKEVEKTLRREVDPYCWRQMEEKGRVAHLLAAIARGDKDDVREETELLLDDYRRCEATLREGKRRSKMGTTRPPPLGRFRPRNAGRWEILSLLSASEARGLPEVRALWEEVVPPIRDVNEWFSRHSGGAADQQGTLELPDRHGNSNWIVRIPSSGVLHKLKLVAGMLCERYGWREFQAVHFLLTQRAPRSLWPATAEILVTDADSPYGDRVVLSLDPHLTPQEVTAFYRQLRAKYFGESRPGHPRPKAMNTKTREKTYALVRFVLRKRDGRSWERLLELWNKYGSRRGWTYSSSRTMARDFYRAQRSLMPLVPRVGLPPRPSKGQKEGTCPTGG